MIRGGRHLLGIDPLSAEDLERLLALADRIERGSGARLLLDGLRVGLWFVEGCGSTRLAFENAARSAGATSWTVEGGSRERDRSRPIAAAVEMFEGSADALVIGHREAGVPHMLSRSLDLAVINAGDGTHEHPHGALTDALVLSRRLGQLTGKRIVILGDVVGSRSARSTLVLLSRMGAQVVVCAPPTLVPPALSGLGATVEADRTRALSGASAVLVLPLQSSSVEAGLVPSAEEYRARYRLDRTRLDAALPEAVVLACGSAGSVLEMEPDLPGSSVEAEPGRSGTATAVASAMLAIALGAG
jgi:aspartate carbamoyltransferase catalytic subunit